MHLSLTNGIVCCSPGQDTHTDGGGCPFYKGVKEAEWGEGRGTKNIHIVGVHFSIRGLAVIIAVPSELCSPEGNKSYNGWLGGGEGGRHGGGREGRLSDVTLD